MNQERIYKVTFLINPISGGGAGRRIFRFLPEIMASFGFQRENWHAEFTDPRDLVAQMHRLFPLTEKLIAVGGDGTMNLVLSHTNDPEIELGLIPLGTGNDLSRAMGVWDNFQKRGLLNTVRKLVNTQSKPFDLWKVAGKYHLAAYISMGMDAKVAHFFDRARSQGHLPLQAAWFNKLHYLKSFWRLKSHKLSEQAKLSYQTIDGRWHHKELGGQSSLLLGNINSYGGGACPFGCSIYSDGLLHFIRVKNLPLFTMLMSTTLSKIWAGVAARFLLPIRQGKSFRLTIPKGEFVQIDGEDRSRELAGQTVEIEHVGQVKMLVLAN